MKNNKWIINKRAPRPQSGSGHLGMEGPLGTSTTAVGDPVHK